MASSALRTSFVASGLTAGYVGADDRTEPSFLPVPKCPLGRGIRNSKRTSTGPVNGVLIAPEAANATAVRQSLVRLQSSVTTTRPVRLCRRARLDPPGAGIPGTKNRIVLPTVVS